jgi:hypothetical protein
MMSFGVGMQDMEDKMLMARKQVILVSEASFRKNFLLGDYS